VLENKAIAASTAFMYATCLQHHVPEVGACSRAGALLPRDEPESLTACPHARLPANLPACRLLAQSQLHVAACADSLMLFCCCRMLT